MATLLATGLLAGSGHAGQHVCGHGLDLPGNAFANVSLSSHGVPRFWEGGKVEWYVRADDHPAETRAWLESLAQQATSLWASVCNVRFTYRGSFSRPEYDHFGHMSQLGTEAGGLVVDVMPTNRLFLGYANSVDPDGDGFSDGGWAGIVDPLRDHPAWALAVLTHEIGHVLGFGHSENPRALMGSPTGAHRPSGDDIALCQAIYGPPPASNRTGSNLVGPVRIETRSNPGANDASYVTTAQALPLKDDVALVAGRHDAPAAQPGHGLQVYTRAEAQTVRELSALVVVRTGDAPRALRITGRFDGGAEVSLLDMTVPAHAYQLHWTGLAPLITDDVGIAHLYLKTPDGRILATYDLQVVGEAENYFIAAPGPANASYAELYRDGDDWLLRAHAWAGWDVSHFSVQVADEPGARQVIREGQAVPIVPGRIFTSFGAEVSEEESGLSPRADKKGEFALLAVDTPRLTGRRPAVHLHGAPDEQARIQVTMPVPANRPTRIWVVGAWYSRNDSLLALAFRNGDGTWVEDPVPAIDLGTHDRERWVTLPAAQNLVLTTRFGLWIVSGRDFREAVNAGDWFMAAWYDEHGACALDSVTGECL